MARDTTLDTLTGYSAAGSTDLDFATLGAVHLDDAIRVLLDSPWEAGVAAANVAAESVTVADVAALARGEDPAGEPACTFTTPFAYRHRVEVYLRP